MGTLPECAYSFHQLWVRKAAVGNILKANKYVFFEQHHSDVQHWRKTKMTVCHLCAPWPLQVTGNRSNCQTSTAFLPVLKGWVAFQKSLIYTACVSRNPLRKPHLWVHVSSYSSQLPLLEPSDVREKFLWPHAGFLTPAGVSHAGKWAAWYPWYSHNWYHNM